MSIKCIIFARVSNKVQTFERQISDCKPIALQNYKESEIAIIKYKESASKNDLNHRLSLQELINYIETEQIEEVIVHEISRLARRQDVYYSVMSLLESKRICLTVVVPSLLRTIENGKSNPIAHLVFSFLAQVAESETIHKIERIKSGLKENRAAKKITGSAILFGYRRDDNNRAEIDQEQAEIVREMFRLYLEENLSTQSIWEKYGKAYFPSAERKNKAASGRHKIINILRNKAYIGEHPIFTYPPIIDKEVFEKCQEKIDSNVMCKTSLKEIYYCQGLLKIQDQGSWYTLSPELYSGCYKSTDFGRNSYSININAIDSLIWGLACKAKAQTDSEDLEKRYKRAKSELRLIEQKLQENDKSLKEIAKQSDRAYDAYLKGRRTQEQYDLDCEYLAGKVKSLENETDRLKLTQVELTEFVTKKENDSMQNVYDYNSLLNITDDSIKQSIIKEVIDRVELSKLSDSKGHYRADVIYKDKSLTEDCYYEFKQVGPRLKMYCVYGDMREDWSNSIVQRIEPTVVRKRREKREAKQQEKKG